jgi:hypothetical protein
MGAAGKAEVILVQLLARSPGDARAKALLEQVRATAAAAPRASATAASSAFPVPPPFRAKPPR